MSEHVVLLVFVSPGKKINWNYHWCNLFDGKKETVEKWSYRNLKARMKNFKCMLWILAYVMSVVPKYWVCPISPVVGFICYIFICISNYFYRPQCSSFTAGDLVFLIRFTFTKVRKLFFQWGNYFILLSGSAKQLAQFHYFIGLNG